MVNASRAKQHQCGNDKYMQRASIQTRDELSTGYGPDIANVSKQVKEQG